MPPRLLSSCQLRLNFKGSLLLMTCILLTTTFYCLLSNPKPSINDLVYETHRQLNNLKDVVVQQKENSNAKEERCGKYLKKLGFTRQPRLFPKDIWSNVSIPVYVTAVNSDQIYLAIGFVKSFIQFVHEGTLFIYDLGLDSSALALLRKACNSTSSTSSTSFNVACIIRKFDFSQFPSHVSDLKLFAFRPIIIQEVLDQTGAVLWLDAQYYFLPSVNEKVAQLEKEAAKEGILSWTINQPTSSWTHSRMFDFFKTKRDNYYFHRMITPNHLLLYNTERIHNLLMLPWVRCALTLECIAPIGAQSSGCRFDKKPMYRYSGCHYYDTSALNVVLGQMFNYDAKPYAASEGDKFFKEFSIEEANDIFTDNDVEIDFGKLHSDSNKTQLKSTVSDAKR